MQALNYLIRKVIFRRALGRGQLKAVCASGEQAGDDSVPPSTEDVTCSTQTCVPSYLLSLLLSPLISVNFTTENINSISAESLYQKVSFLGCHCQWIHQLSPSPSPKLSLKDLWQVLGFFWLLVTFLLVLYLVLLETFKTEGFSSPPYCLLRLITLAAIWIKNTSYRNY